MNCKENSMCGSSICPSIHLSIVRGNGEEMDTHKRAEGGEVLKEGICRIEEL